MYLKLRVYGGVKIRHDMSAASRAVALEPVGSKTTYSTSSKSTDIRP